MVSDDKQLSYRHRGGELPLRGETIDHAFRDVAARFPDRDAVVSIPQSKRLTYAELDARVEALARGLIALGVESGDRVGIWSTDNVEWVVVQLGAARVGAVLVNINPANRSTELRHALEVARVEMLFLIPSFRSSSYIEMVRRLCPECESCVAGEIECKALPSLESVVVYDPKDSERTERPARGMFTWMHVIERGLEISDSEMEARIDSLNCDDPINIQFTSGTTGFPKAVVLTHHNILNNALFTARVMRFTHRDRLCVAVPFYHCFGMVVANLACLLHGAAIVIPAEHFDAGASLRAIDAERCTAIYGVPTMFVAELEHPEFEEFDLSSLRTGIMAGAPCPPELVSRVMEIMGCREILIGYGQTEASPITHLTRPDDSLELRVGTVGTNLDHQEVKVIDMATGRTVPIGVQGEVCFRGYHVMHGYFGDEAATREAIDDAGWLHSGDLGVLRENGYLEITGRLKDMIIRGGENIYPAEIEAFYFTHPKIAEMAVFGLPDRKLGEEIAAWVKLHKGESATPDEIREFARDSLAHFKIPRHVWIVDEFPLTVTGKIQKYRMREIAQSWLDVPGEAPDAS